MDGLDFEASVWASAADPNHDMKAGPSSFTVQPFPSHNEDEAAFDDDDFDFDAPARAAPADAGDDELGDFGDFDNALQETDTSAFVQTTTFEGDGGFFTPRSLDWEALQLDPLPSHAMLRNRVEGLLQPLWESVDSSEYFSDENIRQVGGLNQVLVTGERCGHCASHCSSS